MSPQTELVAKFGPYELVVRPSEPRDGTYYAVLWRTGDGLQPAQKLLRVTAPTLEEARALLESKFYEERLKHCVGSDASKYAVAWSYLWSKLTENQRVMLRAQYRAPNRTMTTKELAAEAGWKSHSSVNLWYGLAGFVLFGEVPVEIEVRNEHNSPVYSFAISTGERVGAGSSSLWAWTMRPEVAAGFEVAGCVT